MQDILKKLLEEVKSGKLSIDKAMDKLKSLPYEDIDIAKIDTHRELRTSLPEVIFCQGKTIEQIILIVKKIKANKTGINRIIATRANKEIYKEVKKIAPEVVWYEQARIIASPSKNKNKTGNILVITAGTSDIPVAEEAVVIAELMGNKVNKAYDVGVAGIHRLFSIKDKLFDANVIVAVAGMEGALASIVGGLVDVPVIAVPTSIGYGASFNGLAPLLTMLNCCAPGVSVVNIDNGFGAGYLAGLINKKSK
ncbi:MAG: nickel pincer cofactor biosynthesis protein LarB [bacterium]|nr:nickel pincer cofactor biosynthesis protein LarB [bacterium]